MSQGPASRNGFWIPSLYFAEGIPYVVAMSFSTVLYKDRGISNTDIALYTSLLYLPWVIKPLWSPLVDMYRTKRQWIWTLQLAAAAMLIGAGLVMPLKSFFGWSLAFFWILALVSATHDIAADGFYMLGLSRHDQAWWVGWRNTFYRLATIAGGGIFVMLAGRLEKQTGNVSLAWGTALGAMGVMFAGLGLWHSQVLPHPAEDVPSGVKTSALDEFGAAFKSFFARPGIVPAMAFFLLYRFAESQSVKLISPFLLDAREKGGLGLMPEDVGLVYGTIGVVALLCGGVLGGWLASQRGLKSMLPWMVCSIHLPNLALLYLAYNQPDQLAVTSGCLAVEQFGYGFGFTAYMLYMLHFADGPRKTANYAICTGFMALGMMLPGAFAGALQEWLGYRHFFLWVMLCTIPGFLVAFWIKIDPQFGKK